MILFDCIRTENLFLAVFEQGTQVGFHENTKLSLVNLNLVLNQRVLLGLEPNLKIRL